MSQILNMCILSLIMSKLKRHRIQMIKGRDIEFYCNGILFHGDFNGVWHYELFKILTFDEIIYWEPTVVCSRFVGTYIERWALIII